MKLTNEIIFFQALSLIVKSNVRKRSSSLTSILLFFLGIDQSIGNSNYYLLGSFFRNFRSGCQKYINQSLIHWTQSVIRIFQWNEKQKLSSKIYKYNLKTYIFLEKKAFDKDKLNQSVWIDAWSICLCIRKRWKSKWWYHLGNIFMKPNSNCY